MRKTLATVLLVAGTILSTAAQAAECPGADYGIQVLTFDVGSSASPSEPSKPAAGVKPLAVLAFSAF